MGALRQNPCGFTWKNVKTCRLNTKSNVTVYLNAELASLAREMGLTLSKTCENALKQAINRLQGFNVDNTAENKAVWQNINGGRGGI